MEQIHEVVIQNRLALDILMTEKGAVCKVFNTRCGFYIPASVTDLITNMNKTVSTPPPVDNSWFPWFWGLWGGWGNLLLAVILHIVIVLTALFLLACLLVCTLWLCIFSALALIRSYSALGIDLKPEDIGGDCFYSFRIKWGY